MNKNSMLVLKAFKYIYKTTNINWIKS